MSRTTRNIKNISSSCYLRHMRHKNYLMELEKAEQEIKEYLGRCTHNRIKARSRIPTNYDDKLIAATDEVWSYKPW